MPDRSLTDPIEARDFIWLSCGEGDLRLFPFTRVQFDTFSRFLFHTGALRHRGTNYMEQLTTPLTLPIILNSTCVLPFARVRFHSTSRSVFHDGAPPTASGKIGRACYHHPSRVHGSVHALRPTVPHTLSPARPRHPTRIIRALRVDAASILRFVLIKTRDLIMFNDHLYQTMYEMDEFVMNRCLMH